MTVCFSPAISQQNDFHDPGNRLGIFTLFNIFCRIRSRLFLVLSLFIGQNLVHVRQNVAGKVTWANALPVAGFALMIKGGLKSGK
jgi:hypothetical protein